MKRLLTLAGALCAIVAATCAIAAPGSLDPSFGSGGIASLGSVTSARGGVLLHPAGRIIAGGSYNNGFLAAFDTNGVPDPGFGSGGLAGPFAFPTGYLALQDDRILTLSGALSRLLPGGTLDASFGSAGTVGALASTFGPNAFVVQPDGRIVAVAPLDTVSIRRLERDGAPDFTFGSGGVATGPTGVATAVALQPDGRLVVAGMETVGLSRRIVLARFDAQGVRDMAFAAAPATLAKLTSITGPYPLAIAIQPDGRIVVGGWDSYNYFGGQFAVWRFLETGAPDPSFGTLGKAMLPVDVSSGAQAIALQPDGKILAGGWTANGVWPLNFSIVNRAALVRFTRDGVPDPTFGTGGVAILPYSSTLTTPTLSQLAFQPDAKLLAALSGTPQLAVARFLLAPEVAYSDPAGDADGDGIPNALEFGLGLDASIKDNDVFTDARLFAMQQYRDFLAREGDPGGIAYWAGRIESHAVSRAEVVESFLGSAEFQGAIAPVARLYFAYFLRIPDYGGMAYWTSQYRAGMGLETISNYFALSGEFAAMYGGLSNAQFVERVYQNVLGRAPDPGGLAYWTAQLDGGMTRGQLMLQFSESAEYRTLISAEVYVTMTYMGMLRRAPDPGGFSYWVIYLDGGNSITALINGFLGSAEYHDRFLP